MEEKYIAIMIFIWLITVINSIILVFNKINHDIFEDKINKINKYIEENEIHNTKRTNKNNKKELQ